MLDRRTLIAAVTGSLALPCRTQASKERIRLWPQGPPGGGGPEGGIRESGSGQVYNVSEPAIEVFRPNRPNGSALLIAGGGGYRSIGLGSEAYPAAAWAVAQGITAFVLTYRLPREGWRDAVDAPLQDAQRALRLIRGRVVRDHLDPGRIGVLGFSAGGYLMASLAVRDEAPDYLPDEAADTVPVRPAHVALLYPVISLQAPFEGSSTARQKLGSDTTDATRAAWSIETQVRTGCPPFFVVQADDDPIVDPAQAGILEAACRKVGVPVELHRFRTGGHAFGLGRPGSPTAAWPDLYRGWLARLGAA